MKKNIDITIIIPSYNSGAIIAHVISTVDRGLNKYFPNHTKQILIIDSSTDGKTKDIIQGSIELCQSYCKTIYQRRRSGKGKKIIRGLQMSTSSNSLAVAMFDGDLKSIRPDWVQLYIQPILDKKSDFIGPKYIRDKYDSLITNHIIYPVISTLLQSDLRQPIGGDFSFSKKMVNQYLKTVRFTREVSEFGIDIWLSFNAIVNNFKISQIYLGTKDHAVTIKDPVHPENSLGRMFEEVVMTLFDQITVHKKYWIAGDKNKVTEINDYIYAVPKPVAADFHNLWNASKRLYPLFKDDLGAILPLHMIKKIDNILINSDKNSSFDVAIWAEVILHYIKAYMTAKGRASRERMVKSLLPLYFARIACFVIETDKMSNIQVEEKIQSDLDVFKRMVKSLKKTM